MTVPPSWLALLAELPADAQPTRRAVLSPELAHTPHAAAVAGWYSLVLHLSLPGEGIRVLMATFDAEDILLSGSDMVQWNTADQIRSESLGGRFEVDGAFRGTHWAGGIPADSEDWSVPGALVSREPTADETLRLRALLDELCRRPVRKE